MHPDLRPKTTLYTPKGKIRIRFNKNGSVSFSEYVKGTVVEFFRYKTLPVALYVIRKVFKTPPTP